MGQRVNSHFLKVINKIIRNIVFLSPFYQNSGYISVQSTVLVELVRFIVFIQPND